jgi:hypothetical protein
MDLKCAWSGFSIWQRQSERGWMFRRKGELCGRRCKDAGGC